MSPLSTASSWSARQPPRRSSGGGLCSTIATLLSRVSTKSWILYFSAFFIVLFVQEHWSNDRAMCHLEARAASLYYSTYSTGSDGPLFQRTNGPNWEIWNRSSVLFANRPGYQCTWRNMTPYQHYNNMVGQRSNGNPVPVCGYEYSMDSWIQRHLHEQGRWHECDILSVLLSLDEAKRRSSPQSSQRQVYVEVGTHIGLCLMQVLLTTNATIVAFEPNPRNLFRITSTIMSLDQSYRDRVHLFPIAAGKEPGSSTINTQDSNAGNGIVSKRVIQVPNQRFHPPETIFVERVDDILSRNLDVSLAKLDAQGSECYIVDGMTSTLRHTRMVHFETEKSLLNAFDDCSVPILWEKFQSADFTLNQIVKGNGLSPAIPHAETVTALNLVAVKDEVVS